MSRLQAQVQAPGSRPRLQPCAPFQVPRVPCLQGSHAPVQAPLSEHPGCTPGSRLQASLSPASVLCSCPPGSRLQAPCSRLCSRLQAPGSRPGPGSLSVFRLQAPGNPGSRPRLCVQGAPGSIKLCSVFSRFRSVRLQAPCSRPCAVPSLSGSRPALHIALLCPCFCLPGSSSSLSSRPRLRLQFQAPGSSGSRFRACAPEVHLFCSSVIQATCGSRLQAPCAGVPCSVSVPAHCSQAPAQACSSVPVPVPVLRLCAQCSVSVLCAWCSVPLFVLCALCSVRA
jgi:hypothetical protein